MNTTQNQLFKLTIFQPCYCIIHGYSLILRIRTSSLARYTNFRMSTKVSIIIPVYNSASYLPRCLESVTRQSLEQIEIICVDDGSTDSSYEVLKEWAGRDNRIIVLQQSNGRQGKARNTALAVARGEYIGMVDSDDYIPTDYFERLYNAAEQNNADSAVCGIVKEKRHRNKTVISYNREIVKEDTVSKLQSCNCPPDFHPVNKLYRRSMLERVNLRFAENVQYEDVMFVLRAICEGGRMVTVPGINYIYVHNPASTVKSRQTSAKQQQKYIAHRSMVDYTTKKGIYIAEKHRNITVRYFSLFGICLWKIKEKDDRRTLRLFDFLPVWSWKRDER